jgi:hypothetical protein
MRYSVLATDPFVMLILTAISAYFSPVWRSCHIFVSRVVGGLIVTP